jgi:adhesin/invasin
MATSAANSTLVASDATIQANGLEVSTLTVTLKDAGNAPVVGHSVVLDLTANGDNVTISAPSGVSDAEGVVTFTVSSESAHTGAGKTRFTARDVSEEPDISVTQTVDIDFQPVPDTAQSTVAAADGSCVADGNETETVTVTLLDADGLPVPGHTVSLAVDEAAGVTIGAASGASDAQGVVTLDVSAVTAGQGVHTFTATDTTLNVEIGSDTVDFVAVPDAAESTLEVSTSSAPADNATDVYVTATLLDALGAPVVGHVVSLAATANNTGVVIGPAAQTDENGQATFAVNSATVHTGAAKTEFTATDTTVEPDVAITQTVEVDFYAADAAEGVVSVSAERCPADNATTVTITATVKDAGGNPIAGQLVSLEATANGDDVTIGSSPAVTNAQGVATFTAKSSAIHGAAAKTEFTATATLFDPDIVITDTAEVEFYGVIVADAASLHFVHYASQPALPSKALKVTSTPTVAEITAAIKNSGTWLSIPATFTDDTAENVALARAGLANRSIWNAAEVLQFTAEGYDTLEVPVKLTLFP